MIIFKIFITFSIFINLVRAEETILYLNFNSKLNNKTNMYSSERNGLNLEIEAAKAAALKSGRKLVIFPDSTSKKLNYESLKEFLSNGNTKSINSIVISGHNGNGTFGGMNGEIKRDEMMELFKDPSVKSSVQNVEALHLLGCYTGVPGVVNKWSPLNEDSALPSLKMISGFDNKSPFSDDSKMGEITKNLLSEERNIINSAEDKQLKEEVLKNMKLLNPKGLDLTLLLNSCGEDYYINKGLVNNQRKRERNTPYMLDKMSEIIKECENNKGKINDLVEKISCWREPVTGDISNSEGLKKRDDFCKAQNVDDPPNPNGALRSLYSQYLEFSHCFELEENTDMYVSPESLLRTLFSENVFKNTMRHATTKNLLKSALKELGDISPSITKVLKNALEGKYVTRKEWMSAMDGINHLIDIGSLEIDKVKKLTALQKFSDTFIRYHDPIHIPMNYIESNLSQQEIDSGREIPNFIENSNKDDAERDSFLQDLEN